MDQIARIEQELDHFPHTLSLYREQLGRFLNRRADQVSHALDLPSLMGMDRRIKLGDTSKVVSSGDDDFFSTVAQCPANGILLIESQFESVYDIPLGNIQVEVVAREGGERTRVTLDEQGKGQFKGTPGKSYWVHVQSAVTPEQVSELFKSYDGLTAQLQDWLRGEWQGFKPRWPQSTAAAVGNGLLAGSWAALVGVWDRVGELSAILQDPRRFAEQLGDGARQLAELAEKTPEAMARLQLLASDEAVLCLLLRTASLWLEMLPPSVMAGVTAESLSRFVVELLIDLLIGVVLTFAAAGAGVAYLSMRLARHGAQLLDVVLGFVKAIFGLVSQFIGYVDRYKTVAARGVAAGLKKGRMQLRWNAKRNTTLKPNEHHDDAPQQAKNPNGDSADTVERTATNQCPVSMVTGEELLTLTDGTLDGILPFDFTRLYRTSAVELDCGLGFGWSHSLSQHLELDGEQLLWVDHENRRTPFPRPTRERPVIHNSLSRAAIYLGEAPNELILALAGDTPRFYHFQDGRLTAISDAYGNRLRVQRDHLERIQRLDNGAGRALFLRYEHQHLVAVDYQVYRPADREADAWRTEQTLVSYRYDARQRLIEARNAAGESEHYDYDEQHVILQRQLAGGASFFWAWERAGKAARCIRHWASFAQMEARYVWDDHGSVTVQNSDGSREVYQHDERARLVRRVGLDGGERHTAYDAQGRLIAEQDALGAVTEYRYDEVGRLIARLPPDEAPTFYEYRHGFLHARRRGDAEWQYQRNTQGDISALTDPDGQVTRYFYDPQGRLLTVRYPDQSGHHFVWNGLGQLLEETLPDGGQRAFSYDALGRRITQRDEHGGVTAYAWDAVGRLIQTIFPTGARRSYAYNAYGQVTAETDELGRVTRFEYADDLHLVSRRINPDGSTLNYRYDHAQLLLTAIDNEVGDTYRLDYTPGGLIREETGFDGRRTAYAYDLNGQLSEKTEFGDDGSQRVTHYQRDAAGRLLLKTLPDGVKVAYRYDDLGRLRSVDDGQDHPLEFEYDRQDRLITEHQGWGTLRYAYDSGGRLKRLRLPDGCVLDYQHAPGGALTAIDLNGSRLTSHRYKFGREQQRQQGRLLSVYAYDEQGRLQAHAVRQNHRALYRRDYAYSAHGNLLQVSDSRHGQRHYQYDPLDRLTRVRHLRDESMEHFSHDPAGNLLIHDRPGPTRMQGNRLRQRDDGHYDYDAFGNLVRERRGTPARVTDYRYDSQHRLIGVTTPDGTTASYRYDAFGRRIGKTVNGQTTHFFWQGDQLVAESGPKHYRSYLYEPGSFRPLALLDGKGRLNACPFYYQLDHLGTPQELTSYGGAIVWSAKYTAHGQLRELSHGDGEQLDQPLRFQGQYFDAESGLHYNRHRYYHPDLGRYLTPDPIKLAGGLNPYQYTRNPTGWVDPLGLNGNCPGANRPGCSVPNPVGGAKVDEGEPALPKMSAEQRRARVDELAEANAKRRVIEFEEKYQMHTVAKHSSEISDQALRQRAINGADPHTGVAPRGGRGNLSSQFKNWRMHLNALNKAMTRESLGLSPHTGKDHNNDPIVRMELPGAGRGYRPNRNNANSPKLNEDLNWFEVKFDKNDITRPYTGFPTEKK